MSKIITQTPTKSFKTLIKSLHSLLLFSVESLTFLSISIIPKLSCVPSLAIKCPSSSVTSMPAQNSPNVAVHVIYTTELSL